MVRARILVTGATGYLGGRLVPLLLDGGHEVRALTRDPSRLPVEWRDLVEPVAADAGDADSVARAAAGCDVAYFLIHSLHRDDFEAHDRDLAEAFRRGCQRAGVGRIVYLGGLGREGDPELSPHLRSRHEVGQVLADGPVPVTELRAAVVIGSGSASFEMLRSLTEVLPTMVVPRWVHRSRCQPIAAADVLQALVAAAHRITAGHEILELGGPDVVTYEQMMQRYARSAGLRRRRILAVPVLSPRLSSRWVTLVTPLPGGLSRQLVDSLTNDVIVTRPGADEALGLHPMSLDDAIGQAISMVQDLQVPTRWSSPQVAGLPGTPDAHDPSWAGGTVLEDKRVLRTDTASPEQVFAVVTGIGGGRGWFWGDWMWRLRGLVDLLVGGTGLRRGRRHPDELRVGEALDFWVVEVLEPGHLRLRAEMRMPGWAWLEWEVGAVDGQTELRQRARFVPRGALGRMYWWAMVPFHQILFPRMARAIVDRAATTTPVPTETTLASRPR